MTDRDAPHPTVSAEWPADFRAAEDHTLDASLAATPTQRLAWLEEALAFALRVGALSRPDERLAERNGGTRPQEWHSDRTAAEALPKESSAECPR